MGGRSNGKTYTLELAMFGQEVLNEMSEPSHGSEKQTDVIYELINIRLLKLNIKGYGKKVIKLFDVNVITIDDKSINMKNVRQLSLTSARLILVDDQGKQEMLNPGIIDCLNMFNVNHYVNEIMKEGD